MRRARAVFAAVAMAGVAMLAAGCQQPGAVARPASSGADASLTAPKPHAVSGKPAVNRTDVTSAQGMTCATYHIPVTGPAENGSTRYHVAADLCASGAGFGASKTVEVLVPGGGYDHWYWMWPDANYSYARSATRAGYVTLALDPLGVSGSDHPDGSKLTYAVQSKVLHQVVSGLHGGDFGVSWDRVVLVGHSMGGYASWMEAGTYRDVSGVVLLDAAHTTYQPTIDLLTKHMHPADSDERFDMKPWASKNYMAIAEGTRDDYYWVPGADPEVIAVDERINGTVAVPLGQLTDLGGVMSSDTPGKVTAPVLLVVGQHDPLLCGSSHDCSDPNAAIDQECDLYAAARSCDLWKLPDAGHTTNLHRTAPQMFDHVNTWVSDHS